MAFLLRAGYSSITEIQKASNGSCEYFNLSPRSLERLANSSSSRNSKLERLLTYKSRKGLRIQSNSSMLIEGKYSSILFCKHVKCSLIMRIISVTQVLWTDGNISKSSTFILFFQIAIFFLKVTNLSVTVRMFSFLPCILLFRLLRCPNISLKYSILDIHNSFLRFLQNLPSFSFKKKLKVLPEAQLR